MRVYTSGVRVVDGLLGARLCLLAVFVFVFSISSDTAANDTIEEPIRHRYSSLTEKQRNSTVTIEFNFKHIDKTNRAALRIAYLETRRKILGKLNSRRRSTSSPTNPTTVAADTTIVATATTIATTAATTADVTTTATSTATSTITTLASTTVTSTNPTTIVTTIPTEPTTTTAAIETTQTTLAVESTTETTTTVSTATGAAEPPPNRKRKRRNTKENNSTLTDDDLPFIENDLEFDENGILRISFSINSTEFSDDDLWKALNELETDEDGFKEIAPVIDIYPGLPTLKGAMAMAGTPVWLPILLAIIILIIIFIVVFCCWKATNKKVRDIEHQKIVPKQDSKPSPSNSRSAHPRILDDNSGWLVPYEQFGSEQK